MYKKKKNIFIMTILLLLVIVLFLATVSCKNNNSISRLSGDWNVVFIDDIKVNPEDFNNKMPFIRFDTLKKMISGDSGCNSFSAEAIYTENNIEIGVITSTLIACENMEIEEQLFKILNSQTVLFNFNGDALIVTNALGDKITMVKSTSF